VKAKVVKNKVAPPFQVCEFDIMYNEGISYEGDVINTAIKYALVSKSGSWIIYNDQKLGQGMEAAKKFLRENPKITTELAKLVKAKAGEEQI